MILRKSRRNKLSAAARAMRNTVFRMLPLARAHGNARLLRQQFDLIMASVPVPPGVSVETTTLGGIPVEILTPQLRPTCGALLYIHGGGYVIGSARTHRAMAARLGIHARMKVYLPEYRLAPEHPFPAAPDDVLAAYRAVAEREPRLVVGGESAGGGLSVALCHDLIAARLPLPAKLYLQSPWLDLTQTSRSHSANDRIDPILKTRWLESQFARHYAGSTDRRHPRLSPLFGEVSGFPPTLIHVGTHETLYEDALGFAGKLEAAKLPVRLIVGHGLWHGWPIFAPLFPEASQAVREAGQWLRLDPNPPETPNV